MSSDKHVRNIISLDGAVYDDALLESKKTIIIAGKGTSTLISYHLLACPVFRVKIENDLK